MPTIRPSSDLRNNNNETSQLCGKCELYKELLEGLSNEEKGETRPFSEAISDIRKELK